MIGTVIYGYDYSSDAIWVLGTVGVAYGVHWLFPDLPKLLAAFIGYVLALATAYGLGRVGGDLSVAHQLEFYIYYVDSTWVGGPNIILDISIVLFHLLPVYYADRLLITTGRSAHLFSIVPILIAIILALLSIASESTRSNDLVLPIIHLVVAGLFLVRGWRTKEPNKSGEGTA